MSEGKNALAVDSQLLDEARGLDIDASAVAERAIFHEIRRRRTPEQQAEAERKFKEENADEIAWNNKYFEENGFPFAQYQRY